MQRQTMQKSLPAALVGDGAKRILRSERSYGELREHERDHSDTASEVSNASSVRLDTGPIKMPSGEPMRPFARENRYRNTQTSYENEIVQQRPGSVSSTRSERPTSQDKRSAESYESQEAYETDASSIHTLPPLQTKGPPDGFSLLEPVLEDDPASYDLITPAPASLGPKYSLEDRAEQMFSTKHLTTIFKHPEFLLRFTSFLGKHRPESIPLLIYYLDALKALKAIKYANAVAEALEPLSSHEFTTEPVASTVNKKLEERAEQAFKLLAEQDLPAYITSQFIRVVSVSIHQRVTGTMPPHLREASEGLAEVFCLTDPLLPDNPIIFASEEFHRTTQYGVDYAIGRNCRFLQGPRTNRAAIQRISTALKEGRDHCETFINYRRDGSVFMNLLMMAPLRDSRGKLRYFIGAQCDVSGLAKECSDLEAFQQMLKEEDEKDESQDKDEFEELSEMFNMAELETVKKYGGKMHREHADDKDEGNAWHRPRLLLRNDQSPGEEQPQRDLSQTLHGKLVGIYQNYLLVRPYPSLRILFTSPSLRLPGILQSPFMNRIGSSERVRSELTAALAEGRGVTAKVKWITRKDEEGRNRWIHCTPLLGQTGAVGVWMVVLVDEENAKPSTRRFRQAPPVPTNARLRHEASAKKHVRMADDSPLMTPTRNHPSKSASGGSEFDFQLG